MKVFLEVEIEEAWSEDYVNNDKLLERHLTGRLQGIEVKVIKVNGSEVDITKPLEVGEMTIDPIDEEGGFEFEILNRGNYIDIEEAKEVINYLTKSINEQQT